MSAERQIFRQRSLDKLSSPERLDQLVRIVRPQSWILLTALAACLAFAIAWGIVGRVPTTAEGAAILVRPKQIVPFQSPASGQIATIEVASGQQVRAGDLLATLDLRELRKSLELERASLALVQEHGERRSAAEAQLAARERHVLEQERALLRDRIERVQREAESYKLRASRYLEQQRSNLATAKERAVRLGTALDEQYAAFLKLHSQQEKSTFELIEPQTKVIDNELRLADLAVRSEEVNLNEDRVQEYYDERLDTVRDLEIRLHRLDVDETAIERRRMEQQLEIDAETKRAQQRVDALEVQLDTESRVVSKYTGRVLEATATIGEQVVVGQRLGKLEIDDPSTRLKALAYFRVKDGKKIRPGTRIRVSPATVELQRFGGIVGAAETVSDFPVTTEAAAHQIGDVDIARALLGGETRIEVVVALERDESSPTSYRWTSGRGPSDLEITPGTTGSVRATLEHRAPITLVLPFLESLFDDQR